MPQLPRHFKVDAYVMETLLPDLVLHDHRPSTFIVYLYLWYRAAGTRGGARVSHQEMATATGLSKSAVQGAVRILIRRRLVEASREGITAVPQYRVLRPWRR
jgi:DNA-binding MarR family transcriptional regulator